MDERMRDRHHPKAGALRLKLMAGAALCALPIWGIADLAEAQTAAPVPTQGQPTQTQTTAPQRGEDGLVPGSLYVEADLAERQGDVVSAKGRAIKITPYALRTFSTT
jgi:LPS-assembly protein